MSKQAMQMALDALEWADNGYKEGEPIQAAIQAAIAELRAALDAPVEPVGEVERAPDGTYFHFEPLGVLKLDADAAAVGYSIVQVYNTPPDTEGLRKELERIGAQNAKLYDDFNKSQLELERVKGALETAEALLLSMGMESSDAYQETIAALTASDAAIAAQGGKV
jgi:hypothetical protein